MNGNSSPRLARSNSRSADPRRRPVARRAGRRTLASTLRAVYSTPPRTGSISRLRTACGSWSTTSRGASRAGEAVCGQRSACSGKWPTVKRPANSTDSTPSTGEGRNPQARREASGRGHRARRKVAAAANQAACRVDHRPRASAGVSVGADQGCAGRCRAQPSTHHRARPPGGSHLEERDLMRRPARLDGRGPGRPSPRRSTASVPGTNGPAMGAHRDPELADRRQRGALVQHLEAVAPDLGEQRAVMLAIISPGFCGLAVGLRQQGFKRLVVGAARAPPGSASAR